MAVDSLRGNLLLDSLVAEGNLRRGNLHRPDNLLLDSLAVDSLVEGNLLGKFQQILVAVAAYLYVLKES